MNKFKIGDRVRIKDRNRDDLNGLVGVVSEEAGGGFYPYRVQILKSENPSYPESYCVKEFWLSCQPHELEPILTKPLCKRCGKNEVREQHIDGLRWAFAHVLCVLCDEKKLDKETIAACAEYLRYDYDGGEWLFDFGEGEEKKAEPEDESTAAESENPQPTTLHTAHIRAQLADGRIVESPRPDPKGGWREVWSDRWQAGECCVFSATSAYIETRDAEGVGNVFLVDKCWLKDMCRCLREVKKGCLKIPPYILSAARYERTVTPEPTHYRQPFPLLAREK